VSFALLSTEIIIACVILYSYICGKI